MSLPPELQRPLRATAARVRVQRALDAAATLGFAGLGVAGLAVALVKIEALPEEAALPWLVGAATLPLVGALVGALRPVPALMAAKLLDRAHGTHDRVSNAVSFAELDARTPFMEAALDDARARAKEGLHPKRAMPLALPGELVGVALLAVLVLGLSALEVPRVIEQRALTGGIDAVMLHADDLDAYESGLRELLDDPETPDEVRAAAQEFNRLVEDLADERLDQAEALRRLSELEAQLRDTRPADTELMRESLEQLGADMARAELAEELSRALQEADAERAEAEMRRLAERLRQDDPSRAELERLRRALQRAAENQPEDRTEELQQREEEMQRLLQRQREGTATPQEQRLLQRRQRELERLRRENQEALERRRQLERLQREMSQGAEHLNDRQNQDAAGDMDRGAEELNRMAQEQMSDEEMRRLQQQLEQLRELIRQQQQSGQGQQQQQQRSGQGQSRMDRFVLRANGQSGGAQLRMPGQGQQGQGQQQGQQGQQQGQQGQGQQPGQGQQGQGGQQGGAGGGQQGQGQDGQGGQQVLTLGGDGEANATLEIPGMGQGQQQGGQGNGPSREGPGAGAGHDPTTGDPTRLGGSHANVRVEGEQRGGPSRSEVIMGGAQRGFADRAYRDVYTDYSGHAEEVLERDEVPPGYRFYVRRYFQLIRPRDGR